MLPLLSVPEEFGPVVDTNEKGVTCLMYERKVPLVLRCPFDRDDIDKCAVPYFAADKTLAKDHVQDYHAHGFPELAALLKQYCPSPANKKSQKLEDKKSQPKQPKKPKQSKSPQGQKAELPKVVCPDPKCPTSCGILDLGRHVVEKHMNAQKYWCQWCGKIKGRARSDWRAHLDHCPQSPGVKP
ncbi:hypothetical protein NM688_g5993 [Phlebia brevispora]|uniref:Uncharacterized protein n=1 Tax=Phlebia brevispora TaxID=194682 RepID=A0ACC1SLC8_9APHY|nr:hypothetical protein NM688_g5993 [Phlebia brevispora]